VHPTADVAPHPTGCALAARKIAASWTASRFAGAGESSGMSKKWRRSLTSTSQT
jgi:hypothetical protein